MSPSEPLRILSVEDNPETRLVLRHLLEGTYEIAFASDAEEALEVIGSQSFDLLLLDINLGEGMSGAELLRLIRRREEMMGIPAIALTAYAMPGDREELLESGFDAYQRKPFTRAELAACCA